MTRVVKPLAPHHRSRRSDSDCALKTSLRGASKTREITNSPFSDSVTDLFFFSAMIWIYLLDQYLSACCDQAVDQYDDSAGEHRRPDDGDLCPDGCAVRLSERHVKEKSPGLRQDAHE